MKTVLGCGIKSLAIQVQLDSASTSVTAGTMPLVLKSGVDDLGENTARHGSLEMCMCAVCRNAFFVGDLFCSSYLLPLKFWGSCPDIAKQPQHVVTP